jgi:hypothetical protein
MGDRQRFVKLLRARHACVAIVTSEEDHALNTVVGAALDVGRPVLVWSVVRGLCEGVFNGEHQPRPETQTPVAALRNLALDGQARVIAMLDLGEHLGAEIPLRAWREAVDACRRSGSTLVLIDHRAPTAEVVRATATHFDLDLPDEKELEAVAKVALSRLKVDEPFTLALNQAQFTALVRNLRGLTREQAATVVRDLAVDDDRLDAKDVQAAAVLKRRLLRHQGLLDTIEAPVDLAQVAGVRQLKSWLQERAAAIDGTLPGIEPPRGILLLGVPGAGKSLCAKAIATAWQRPLLRLDAGVLYDRFVGESERRLRDAFREAEAMAPAVLWIDEIEKAFASAASRSSDGGLSQRMFGSLLTWMQEHTAPVFLVATANDLGALPPELLRKGRFDEIFFVDLPTLEARMELFRIHLLRRGQGCLVERAAELAAAAEGYSGAEIEQAVIAALFSARAAGGALEDRHVLAALRASPPLSLVMGERVTDLRAWASTRCRSAD